MGTKSRSKLTVTPMNSKAQDGAMRAFSGAMDELAKPLLNDSTTAD
jgi:hypothetical protein